MSGAGRDPVGNGGAPLDILVAEDNEVNQLVFAQILSGLGLSYRIAGNGRTAVEMHRALKPQADPDGRLDAGDERLRGDAGDPRLRKRRAARIRRSSASPRMR